MIYEEEGVVSMGSIHHEGHISVCTARDCLYNDESRCNADGVMVNLHMDHADCNTYSKNEHIPGQTPDTAQL